VPFASSPESSSQLWMADTASRERIALTSGTAGQGSLAVAPDGHRIVFSESRDDFDLASVDVQHATASRLIERSATNTWLPGLPNNPCWYM
jgi:Tol biopolymer transport system component